MMRRSITFVFLAVLLVLSGGCGGGSDEPAGAQSQGQATAGLSNFGAARGFVVQVNPVFIVSDLSEAPAGSSPVLGAELRAFDLQGSEIERVRTNGDGSFRFTKLPAGYVSIQARVDPNSANPDVTMEITAVPQTTITLGQTFAVNRAAANAIALQGINAGDRVLGSLQPLSAGTEIRAFKNSNGESSAAESRILPADEWFYMIDQRPNSRFRHPVQYVFVDAATGAVTRTDEVWFPVANGGMLWATDLQLFAYTGVDLAILPAVAPGATATPSPEIVRNSPAPSFTTRALPESRLGRVLAQNNTTTNSMFVVIFQGFRDTSMATDANRVKTFFTDRSVPESNIRTIRPGNSSAPQIKAQLLAAIGELNQLIVERLNEGKHSTFVLYVTSHGGNGGFDVETLKGENATDVGTLVGIAADDLQLGALKACRVRVVADFCDSQSFGLFTEFSLASSDIDRGVFVATSNGIDSVAIPTSLGLLPGLETGGRFTSAVLENLVINDADLDDITTLPMLQGGYVSDIANLGQMPTLFREVDSPAFCQDPGPDPTPSPTPTSTPPPSLDLISAGGPSPQGITATHTLGVSPCPQLIGAVAINKTTSADIRVTLSVPPGSPLVLEQPTAFNLTGGGVQLVTRDVFFDCSSLTSFSTTVTITATRLSDGEQEVVQVPVSVTVTGTPPADITGDFDLASGAEAPFATLLDLIQSPTSSLDIAGFRITRFDNPGANFDIVTGCASQIFTSNLGGGLAVSFESETTMNGECTWLNSAPLSKNVLIFLDIEPLFTGPVNQLVVQALDVSGAVLGKITIPISKL